MASLCKIDTETMTPETAAPLAVQIADIMKACQEQMKIIEEWRRAQTMPIVGAEATLVPDSPRGQGFADEKDEAWENAVTEIEKVDTESNTFLNEISKTLKTPNPNTVKAMRDKVRKIDRMSDEVRVRATRRQHVIKELNTNLQQKYYFEIDKILNDDPEVKLDELLSRKEVAHPSR